MGLNIQIGKTGLSAQDRIVFLRTMGTWLASGGGRTSVLEAVRNTCEAFSHDEFATLKPKMDMISREYGNGKMPLYECFLAADLGFNHQEVAVIEAAEKSNQLRVVLPNLVSALDIRMKGGQKMLKSMSVPLLVGFALILMSLGVLLFMLPMVIGPVLERRPDALEKFPSILQYYWHASVWLRANYWIAIGFASAPFVLLILRWLVPYVRQKTDTFLLWFKPSRRMILSLNSVLVVFFMPALVRSG
ncbi:MAG: type II secretion system F family protein, partial [Alphaproteobacteria bacterium]